LALCFCANIYTLSYVHENNLYDIKTINNIFDNYLNIKIIHYLHTTVGFTKDDFRRDNCKIIQKICNDDNDKLFEQVKYLHKEIGFEKHDFDHLIQYVLHMIATNENTNIDFYEYYTKIYLYCVEFFDIDRENININGKITISILNNHKIMTNKKFKCDVCLCNILGHDYKYSPKCCVSYDRNICKECGYNSIGIMVAKCLFCRKDL